VCGVCVCVCECGVCVCCVCVCMCVRVHVCVCVCMCVCVCVGVYGSYFSLKTTNKRSLSANNYAEILNSVVTIAVLGPCRGILATTSIVWGTLGGLPNIWVIFHQLPQGHGRGERTWAWGPKLLFRLFQFHPFISE